MTLLTATALPLLVALREIGLSTGHMLPENAAALVGAGVLSVIVLPGLAVALNKRVAPTAASGHEPARRLAGPVDPPDQRRSSTWSSATYERRVGRTRVEHPHHPFGRGP